MPSSLLLRIALYSALIVGGAAVGAAVALWATRKRPAVGLLAFAAGIMFGAAFFHMLPEAFHSGGYSVLSLVPVGFVLMFALERYVLSHACEEPPDCAEHAGHGRALGTAAFVGLSVHTLFDGAALGSAVTEGVGLSTLIAVVAHKVPSSLSLAAILISEGRRRAVVFAYACAYGMMVPVGVGAYFILSSAVSLPSFAAWALAFSAGTFLYLAVADLLPHVNRHGAGRRAVHLVGLSLGLASMFGLTFVVSTHGH